MTFPGHWVLGQVVNTVILVWSIWLFICTVYYGVKYRKYKAQKRRGSDFSGGVNFISATIAVFGPIPRIVTTQAVSVVGARYPDGPNCQTAMRATIVCYYFAVYTSYMFLWLRQRSFYGHPVLGEMFNKFVKAVSWIALFLLHVSSFIGFFLYVYPRGYKGSKYGCVRLGTAESLELNGSEFLSSGKRAYYVFGGLVVLQILLFGLFLNPLIRKKGFTSSAGGKEQSSKSNRVYSTIKRTTICTVVTIISDILTLVAVSKFKTPMHVTNAAYDVSLCINAICVVASFSDWRRIMMPRKKSQNIYSVASVSNTSGSNV